MMSTATQRAYANPLKQQSLQDSGQSDAAMQQLQAAANAPQQPQPTPQPTQSIFATPFTQQTTTTQSSIQPVDIPAPHVQKEVPVETDDFKKMILPYLQSNDPGVQQYGIQLAQEWASKRMDTQNKMEENQQQLGLNEQQKEYENKLQQANQLQQQQIQAQQPDPELHKALIQQGTQDVQSAKANYDQTSDELTGIKRLDALASEISNTSPAERLILGHLPGSILSQKMQQFEAIKNSLLLSNKPKGLSRLTDIDIQILKSTMPSITFDPEANKNLIHMMRQNLQDENQYTQFVQNYARAHGGITDGAQQVYDQFKQEVPVVTEDGQIVKSRISFNDWLKQKMNPQTQQQSVQPATQTQSMQPPKDKNQKTVDDIKDT